jgi:hypothetical protein
MLFIVGLILWTAAAQAQTFSSGSTGADGALDLTSGDQTLQLPPSGIFNFTTVNIPGGKTLRFLRNALNTPVVMLAQGDVVIGGDVDVSAGDQDPEFGFRRRVGRVPGPGGFFGGFPGGDGFGPGGGRIGGDENGRWVGPLTLVPITGGSGGAGRTRFLGLGGGFFTPNGGGGGGAIVIASSTSITLTGTIRAQGADPCSRCDLSGFGGGGAIRLVANALNVFGQLFADSGVYSGVVQLEAAIGSLRFTGFSSPAPVLSAIIPAILPPTGTPTLTITSVGGFAVPATAGARPDAVDVLLPTQLSDPIPLVVQASNIPIGSPVTLSINGSPGTSTPGVLAGTFESSAATVNIFGLDRTKVIFLFVSTTFEVPAFASIDNPAGTERVAKLRIQSTLEGESTVAFLRSDGSEIDRSRVPTRVRELFGR